MSAYPSPRRSPRMRPIFRPYASRRRPWAADATPPTPRGGAATTDATASPTADDTEWRAREPFDGGALRGCALAMALPGLMALWLAVEVVLWLSGAR